VRSERKKPRKRGLLLKPKIERKAQATAIEHCVLMTLQHCGRVFVFKKSYLLTIHITLSYFTPFLYQKMQADSHDSNSDNCDHAPNSTLFFGF